MTTIAIYGGPLKRVLVQGAYGECGQSSSEFEIDPEDYDAALGLLNALMYEWRDGEGVDLCFNFPTYGNGSPEDESGIPPSAQQVVITALAIRLAPQIGKTIKPETNRTYARSWGILKGQHARTPRMQLTRTTPRGSGNTSRFGGYRGEYYQPSCDPSCGPSCGPEDDTCPPSRC